MTAKMAKNRETSGEIVKDVTRRDLLVKGGKFAAFVTPSLTVLVRPQRADACHDKPPEWYEQHPSHPGGIDCIDPSI
jgi:hypothetical protein